MTNGAPLLPPHATIGQINPPPTIDPTVLTTEQLLREVAALKEFFQSKLDGVTDKYEVRFQAIEHEFEVVEHHRVEQKTDTATAVGAALSAAEKAVREQTTAFEKSILKSETAATEQSRQQYATTQEALKGLQTIFDDLKERVVKLESLSVGASAQRIEHRSESQASLSTLFAIIAVIMGVVSLAVGVVLAVAVR